MRRRLLVTAAAAALAAAVGAQEPGLRERLDEAWKSQRAGSSAAARTQFEQALVRARDEGQAVAESEALRGIAVACTTLGDYETARARLDEALPIAQAAGDRAETGRVLNGLGSVAWYQDRGEARSHWERALAEFEAVGALKDAANTTANIVLLIPERDMDPWLERGLRLADQAGDGYQRGRFLQMRGDLLRGRAEFAGSRAALLEAQRLFEESGRRDAQGSCLNSLGYLHRLHGRPDQALAFQERALALSREMDSSYASVQSLAGVGKALSDLGRGAEATKSLEEALALARLSNLPYWVESLTDMLAEVELMRGRPARAAEIFRQLPHEGKYGASYYAPRLSLLSTALRQTGRVREALGYAERGVEGARQKELSEYLPGSLVERAQCLDALGRPQEALRDGREAIAVIETQRGGLVAEDSLRQGFGERQDAYTFMVGLLHRMGHHEEALEVATKARARAFLDRFALRLGLENTAVSAEPKTVAAATVADVRATARRLDSTVLVYFADRKDAYVWAVAAEGPVAAAKVPLSVARLASLVDGEPAGPGTAARRGAPLSLPTRAAGVLVLGDESARWAQLYDALLRPIKTSLPRKPGARLTVIPDGPLLRLPFGALRDGAGRYLVERYAIHYAPAIGTFEQTARSKAADTPGGTLLVGDPERYPDPGGGAPLQPLPGSRRELDGIARLLGPERVERLSGGTATEARLRERVRGMDVLHFSTHGVVRDDAPMESFVALEPGAGGEQDDGRLTSADVYGLELTADLVFLSACRTARGGVSSDGVSGLTRAFFHAGASSIVATLSDVVDEPAQRLVSDFYQARLNGEDKATALRDAQLAMLKALRAGRVRVDTTAGEVTLPESPALWAPFVLLGEP